MSDAVEPRIFRGLRDYLPGQMRLRNRLIDTVRRVYESYGFLPLGTPAVEYLDVLLGPGGHEANEQIFRVRNPDKPKADSTSGEESDRLGMRFDLTVPLARVISQYPNDLPLPFRRYQVDSVWRADKPDRGRYREFTQFDIDAVGIESELADAEIIAAMCDTLTAVDAGPFKVRFSSRKILNLLIAYAGVPAQLTLTRASSTEQRPASDVFRVLDKLPKIGIEKVRLELTRGYTDESGDKIPGLGLAPDQVARIENFLNLKADSRAGTLDQLTALFAGVPDAEPILKQVRNISDTLAALGYDESKAIIDLSIARGLAYYTGPVFETTLDELPQFGSVMSGGRYDDLVKRFKGTSVPAVGTSIGIDRLLAALVEGGGGKRAALKAATAQVLVTTMDASLTNEYLAIAGQLRRAGIRTEIYLAGGRVGKQMKYADALGIPLVIIIGSDESARGVVQIKQMDLGLQLAQNIASRDEYRQARPGQFEVPRAKLVESIKDLLDGLGA